MAIVPVDPVFRMGFGNSHMCMHPCRASPQSNSGSACPLLHPVSQKGFFYREYNTYNLVIIAMYTSIGDCVLMFVLS